MAVESQYPAFIMLPDSQYRVRQQSGGNENQNFTGRAAEVAPIALQDFQLQHAEVNLLPHCNSVAGLNVGQKVLVDKTIANDPGSNFVCKFRKRPRDRHTSLSCSQAFIPVVDLPKPNKLISKVMPQNMGVISTGLRLSLADDHRSNLAVISGGNNTCLSSVFGKEFESQMIKQNNEINQVIQMEGERLKQALDDKRQEHLRTFLATIENVTLKSLKDKDDQLEKENQRTLELGERVKQLKFESQVWQNIARNSELMVSNLRINLEQVVAHSREQSKEGCGESEVDDTGSCHYGDERAAGVHMFAQTFKENKALKQQRTCRVCLANEVCILLLPCRHLCVCKECESKLDFCPICTNLKTANVQVYMA